MGLLLILAVTLGVFLCTVEWRRPWFGTYGNPSSAIFATNYWLCAKNWYRDGPRHLSAGLYLTPRSVETPTPDTRRVYTSYPPGAVAPVYLAAKLAGAEPTLAMVAACNRLNQFLIALVLALTAFVALRQLRYGAAALPFALIPALLYLLLPAPLYQHQMRYVPDHAVLLPFAALVFLEVLRDGAVERRRLRWALTAAQGMVAFAGILTDYLFGLVAVCVYLQRLVRGRVGTGLLGFVAGSAAFWLPVGLGLALYAYQLHRLVGFEDLAYKLNIWTSSSSDGAPSLGLDSYFWQIHMVRGYGNVGVALLWVSLAAVVAGMAYAGVRRVRRGDASAAASQTLGLAFMVAAPCFLHAFFLKDHSALPFHDFAALKFALPLSLAPFVLLPVLVLSVLGVDPSVLSWAGAKALVARRAGRGRRGWALLLPAAMLVVAGAYLLLEWPRAARLFNEGAAPEPRLAVAKFVGTHTGYEDVVFALDAECALPGDRFLPFAMKPVHRAPSLQRVFAQVAHIEEEYVVNLLMRGRKPRDVAGLDALIERAYDERSADGLRLCKVRKADFLDLCKRHHVRAPEPRPAGARKPRWRWEGEQELIERLTDLSLQVEKLKEAQQQRDERQDTEP